MKSKAVFFTIVDDYYYNPVGTQILINSFKTFHPDIDLVVFRQDIINKVFAEHKICFYNCKPTFAKLLTPYYDLAVNIDADSIILGSLNEILADDYDVGAPINKNDYENSSHEEITENMFLQAGLVASRSLDFWNIWEEENKTCMGYKSRENTAMNIVWYRKLHSHRLRLKTFDEDQDYYGCKSLGREKEFYMSNGKVMCRGEQVFIYHSAKGETNLPKFHFENMGFPNDVCEFMHRVGEFGKSVLYGSFC